MTTLAQPQRRAQPRWHRREEWAENYPREADLPSEVYPMENSLHSLQIRLLINILEAYWEDRSDIFIGDNLTIYFSLEQTKKHDFRGPDIFIVKNTSPRQRNSWVIWEEGKFPNVIIELLSPETAANDRGVKKDTYEQRFQTPEYFWFDPETGEFAGFRLEGEHYVEIQPNEQGWRWSQELELYLGVHQSLLRYFTAGGEMVPAPLESSKQLSQRANAEAQRANAEAQRADAATRLAEQLAAKLRALGIDPNQP